MLCIDPLISGPCVVMLAVSKFVQIPMKHDLLCIAWQFSVESLPKRDRSLIRRRQEILKQIWKLTFELECWQAQIPLSGNYQFFFFSKYLEFWLSRRCAQNLLLQSHSIFAVLVLTSVQMCNSHISLLQRSHSSFCCLLRFPPKHGRSF